MEPERVVLVISIQRPTWDVPVELCRCTTAESMAAVVQALFSTKIVEQPTTFVTVRREVMD